MAVYVDSMRSRFARMIMCHMAADTEEELLAMATLIGLPHMWHQFPGTPKSHFDISLSKKDLAIRAGAIQVRPCDIVQLIRAKRKAAKTTRPSKTITLSKSEYGQTGD